MLEENFIYLLSMCASVSVALSISHKRTRSAVMFGVGILIIAAVLTPLVDIFSAFSVSDYLDEIYEYMDYEEKNDSAIELAFEDGIAKFVSDKYGVPYECVSVFADDFDLESLKAGRIYVTLSGKAIYLDYKSIESELCEKFTHGGECEVSLRID